MGEGLFQRSTPPTSPYPVFSGVESLSSTLGTTLWNEECEGWAMGAVGGKDKPENYSLGASRSVALTAGGFTPQQPKVLSSRA